MKIDESLAYQRRESVNELIAIKIEESEHQLYELRDVKEL